MGAQASDCGFAMLVDRMGTDRQRQSNFLGCQPFADEIEHPCLLRREPAAGAIMIPVVWHPIVRCIDTKAQQPDALIREWVQATGVDRANVGTVYLNEAIATKIPNRVSATKTANSIWITVGRFIP
jgi:hypothetical protein